MHTLLCVLYFAVLILLSSYGIHRSHLVYQCWRHRRKIERALEAGRQPVPEGELPHVTVQLPLFNEATVAVRLLEATTRLDYPRDRLEIQVLDDSTDETQSIARSTVERLRREGTDIVYIHRVDRSGYKAGALANGLKVAKGELVAVFDADFIPSPEFLKATVGHFRTPTVGMVQTRWGHLNRDFSLLTQVQALMLDGHHLVENRARFAAGNLFNFSGTGGIWRKRAIFEAGGWEHDTLTEDLDLSYRAQLAGWRFVYRPDVVSPAELPEDVSAFRAQQYRWAKGTVQTSRKLIARVLRSPLTLGQRLEAFFHLTPHFAYPLMVLLSVLLLPALIFMPATDTRTMLLVDLPLTLGTTGSLGAFYALAEAAQGRSRLGALARLPMLIALGAGLAPHLSKAVFEGLRQMSGEFVRTPKKGMLEGRYRARATIPFTEIGLSMLSVVSVLASIETHHFFATPFAMLFALGYGYVALLVIAEQVQRRREGRVSVAPSSAPAADSERNPLVSDLAALPRGNTRARGGPAAPSGGPLAFLSSARRPRRRQPVSQQRREQRRRLRRQVLVVEVQGVLGDLGRPPDQQPRARLGAERAQPLAKPDLGPRQRRPGRQPRRHRHLDQRHVYPSTAQQHDRTPQRLEPDAPHQGWLRRLCLGPRRREERSPVAAHLLDHEIAPRRQHQLEPGGDRGWALGAHPPQRRRGCRREALCAGRQHDVLHLRAVAVEASSGADEQIEPRLDGQARQRRDRQRRLGPDHAEAAAGLSVVERRLRDLDHDRVATGPQRRRVQDRELVVVQRPPPAAGERGRVHVDTPLVERRPELGAIDPGLDP
jgi:glycosyltransferase involved in cell wall biosynthesis